SIILPEEFYNLSIFTPGYQQKDNVISWLNKPSRIMLQFRAIFKVKLDLVKGWNLIGLPFEPMSVIIEDIFGDKVRYIEVIYGYENGTWYQWIGPDMPNTLTKLRGGHGYWLLANRPFSVFIRGQRLASLNLTDGWNLLAIPELDDISIGEYLVLYEGDAIYGFSEKAGRWKYYVRGAGGTLRYIEPGKGYWIYKGHFEEAAFSMPSVDGKVSSEFKKYSFIRDRHNVYTLGLVFSGVSISILMYRRKKRAGGGDQ
ncbi:MAG: hypothetical protein DRN00_05080, partial [Thermoplasmata archaeon]